MTISIAQSAIIAKEKGPKRIGRRRVLRDEAIEQIRAANGVIPEVTHLLDFIANSPRGVVGRERD